MPVRARRVPSRALAVLALAAMLVAACSAPKRERADVSRDAVVATPGADGLASPAVAGEPGAVASSSPRATARAVTGKSVSAAITPAPVRAPGAVIGSTITVVFYWRGDRTRTSPFLKAAGMADVNADEGQAFLAFVDYVNAHSGGGAKLMGFPFDLHGRKLKGVVLEAGDSPEANVAAAEQIVKEIKPFAAMGGTGSVSAYACKTLAGAGIVSLATYDTDFGLRKRSSGRCLPSAASFDSQVDAVERYLSGRVSRTSYEGGAKRVFGFVYAEYPGLVDSAPKVIDRLKKAGVPMAATASISSDLGTAQQQVPNVIAKMRAAGVNTIVIPDAGAPLSVLNVAEAQQYHPDYVIWPCSGQDVPAMVRLYNGAQWERASGLTCYDRDFMGDLTLDDLARSSEWYAHYKSVRTNDPAAQAPYVYAQFVPLLAGITNAGRDLSTDSFFDGLDGTRSYRYSAVRGPTGDAKSMLMAPGSDDRSLMSDFTVLEWSGSARRSGGTVSGDYVFPEDGKRYARDYAYR